MNRPPRKIPCLVLLYRPKPTITYGKIATFPKKAAKFTFSLTNLHGIRELYHSGTVDLVADIARHLGHLEDASWDHLAAEPLCAMRADHLRIDLRTGLDHGPDLLDA